MPLRVGRHDPKAGYTRHHQELTLFQPYPYLSRRIMKKQIRSQNELKGTKGYGGLRRDI